MRNDAIRPMTAADVAGSVDLIRRHEWGVGREFLQFATEHRECLPLVAEDAGELVATGVGTCNGSVGWLGTIFVAPSRRRLGLGGAITEALLDGLAARGCRSFVLTASGMGRPLYERRGFKVLTTEHVLSAPGLPPGEPDPAIRPLDPGDLSEVATLDRAVTGEDRDHLLRAFARTGWTLRGRDGDVRGYIVRSTIGGSAVVAPDVADARRLIAHRRRLVGPSRTVVVGLLGENRDAIDQLVAEGWVEAWHGPRMILGEPLHWQPTAIWGQFNHAVG